MNEIAKILIIAGLCMAALGVILAMAGKIPGVGKLPGDILIKKENVTFYFPITTSIILSIILSLVLFIFSKK